MAKYVATGRSTGAPRGHWTCSHTDCDDLVYQPQAHYHLCAAHLAELLKLAGVKPGRKAIISTNLAAANLLGAIKDGARPMGEVYYALLASDRVKIGFTTNTGRRMADLRAAVPDLKVLACESGTLALERHRHAQFAHLRIDPRHEVFTLGPDLAAWIDVVRLAGVA